MRSKRFAIWRKGFANGVRCLISEQVARLSVMAPFVMGSTGRGAECAVRGAAVYDGQRGTGGPYRHWHAGKALPVMPSSPPELWKSKRPTRTGNRKNPDSRASAVRPR